MKRTISTVLILSFTLLFFSFSCSDGSNDVVPSTSGQGGSMARFTVVGDYLYVVDTRSLHVYSLADASSPEKLKEVLLGVAIETIFPYQGKLFIGSQEGMHIYDILNPEEPEFLSTYTHVTSCDPVVVQDTLAYVTLRSGNTCWRGQNQLDVISISDPRNPRLIVSYPMENPFGLGIDDTTLFVCEGQFGLKVFDASNPEAIEEIGHLSSIHSFDVIPRNGNLILTGKDGVFQFDYTNPEKLKQKSSLTISSCN